LRDLAPLDALLSERPPEPALSRTPRPPASLLAPSSISSMPASSSAVISFTSESTLPRTIVALDGRRRKPRQFGEPTLVDAEKHPGRPQLGCSDHRSASPARLGRMSEIIPAS
jgi:hypothetical protein